MGPTQKGLKKKLQKKRRWENGEKGVCWLMGLRERIRKKKKKKKKLRGKGSKVYVMLKKMEPG